MDMPKERDNPEYDVAIATAKWKTEPHVVRERADGEFRLYTVSTIARSARFGGTRTPVICMTFDGARKIVENNTGDIWEYSYMFCVIEAVAPDWLYSAADMSERYWYCWDLDQRKYLPIECPEMFENIYGFGIG